VGSRPTAALDAAEATRADVSGDETEDHAVVYMTTLTCGATRIGQMLGNSANLF